MKSWFAPGAFFALIWTVYTLLPILLTQYDMKPLGVLWIFFMVFVVYLGSAVVTTGIGINKSVSYPTINMHKYFLNNLRFLNVLIILFSILGLGGVVILIISLGKELTVFFSLASLSKVANEYSVLRYSDPSYREPGMAILLSSFVYASSFLGGIHYVISLKRYQKFIALFPLIIGVGYSLILSTRASFYFPCILWISSYISIKIFLIKTKFPLFTVRNMILLGLLITIITISYIFLQILRWGASEINMEYVYSASPFLKSAFLGSPVLFSQWFSEHWSDDIIPTLGAYTNPFYKFFGGQIMRYESTPLSDELGSESTVFTLFRDTIEDYTIFGSIFIFLLYGIFWGYSYKKVIQGKITYLPFLSAFYSIAVASITKFIFGFTTILFAWVMFFIIWCLVNKKWKIEKCKF
ncbi:O-antigen polymerase [Thermodesulfovibrio sp. 3462-1]|uniref:O-antigen polymerase n=1 Tax=Thermodesulfovibrio obliviosus TaxID=3118332 RepID=A0AAU8H2P2_9BACT